MTTLNREEKRYASSYIEWNRDYEEYEYTDEVMWLGEPLEFDTYAEFLAFMASLTTDDKLQLGLWRLDDDRTGDYITINDGQFPEVNFLSLNAEL